MVWPTMSGKIVERRDQVRTTFLSLDWFMTVIFDCRCSSMNGPFFAERAIVSCSKILLLQVAILPKLLAAAADDEYVGPLAVACLVSTGRLTPGGDRMTAARGLALAAAVRVVDRVHRDTSVRRTDALPAVAACLAD